MLVLRLAWRNLWRHPRRTLFTAAAIGLGLALLVVHHGLGDGGYQQMIENAVRMGAGHVLVEHPDYLRRHGVELLLDEQTVERALAWGATQPEVLVALPRLFCSGLASSADGSCGILLLGVDPARERLGSRFPKVVTAGEFLSEGSGPRAVIGSGVARQLKVRPGDKLVLMTQVAGGAEIQSLLVRLQGVFTTGLEDLDNGAALIPIGTARELLGVGGRAHQVAFLLTSGDLTLPFVRRAAPLFPGAAVLSWPEALPQLAQYVHIDDAAKSIYNYIFLVVIAFTALNTVLMSVLERRREFALLAALGLRPGRLFTVVFTEACLLGLISLAGGLALGYLGHYYFATAGMPLSWFTDQTTMSAAGSVFDTVIYSRLTLHRVISSLAVVWALVVLIALFPALRAARAVAKEATSS